MSFISSSGSKNDWVVTANKIDAAVAKVREAGTVGGGLPQDILKVYYLRVEKIAADATMILKNIEASNAIRGGPAANRAGGVPFSKDMAIESIGKRAEELITEIDIRISARRFLAAAASARTARVALTAPAVVRPEPREPEAETGERPPEYRL